MPLARLPVRNSKAGRGAMPFTLGIEYGSSKSTNKEGLSRGPAPSSIFRHAGSGKGAPELTGLTMSLLQLRSRFYSFINSFMILSDQVKLMYEKQ